VDAAHPVGEEHAPALGRVLAHPYVGAWAEHCLRVGEIPVLPPEAVYLAAITAAAAIRTGAPARVTVPVSGGYVHLPTLGTLRIGSAQTVEITVRAGSFRVRATGGKWDVHLDCPDLQAGIVDRPALSPVA
jgi:uncharacterized protein